jgi:glycosyltransferase involved in cell wall biosynthesis
MKICLVTAFPPSRGGLSEYGFHLAQELQRDPLLSLTVLADELPRPEKELEGFSVVRCWSFNDPGNFGRLLNVVRRLEPDVVWFNLLFTTFGHNPFAAFCGLSTPLLTRLAGLYTHVTLHHLMDAVDMEDAGVRFPRLYRVAGAAATRLLLRSNSLSVLMPAYRRTLQEKYNGRNVHVRRHGILFARPEYPDFSRRGNPIQRILAFGKWGTYKRLEPLIAAFRQMSPQLPAAQLVIAGGNHPRAAGYLESVARQYQNDFRIKFTGYVPEHKIPDLFRSSSVAVMPYSSATGASGVAHLACAYGVPIVTAEIDDFRQMKEEEDLAIEFYPPGDVEALASCLRSIVASPSKQRSMAIQNFSAALRMTMPEVVYEYLRHFDRVQRTRILKPVGRLRRLPAWFPTFKSRAMARNWWTMADRPTLRSPSNHTGSLNRDRGRRGDLERAGITVDGNGVGPGPEASVGDGLRGRWAAAARREQGDQAGQYDDQ